MKSGSAFEAAMQEFNRKFRMDAIHDAMREKIRELKHVNILIAGKSGVGKTTLINKVFGTAVGKVDRGRPVTQETTWYEPPGLPLRLCDTKGLELKGYETILNDLEQEIKRCANTGNVEDKVHAAWLCISEPGERVEDGEKDLSELCKKYGVPTIVVLTKAIGPEEFEDDVVKLLPDAKAVVRVLADGWRKPMIEAFGLDRLVDETYKLIPRIIEDAFIAAQKIDFEKKRTRALAIAGAAAISAGAGTLIPVPGVGPGSFMAINIGMLLGIAAILGVELTPAVAVAVGTSAVGGLALSFGARMAIGEALKFIPGLGSVAGTLIEAPAAMASTYGIGHAFTEYLIWFHQEHSRMPDAEELKSGFEKYWSDTPNKTISPPPSLVKC